jgi:hypothetical protein
MPFRSKKQRTWLAINRPDIYKRWKAEHGTKIKPSYRTKPRRKGKKK